MTKQFTAQILHVDIISIYIHWCLCISTRLFVFWPPCFTILTSFIFPKFIISVLFVSLNSHSCKWSLQKLLMEHFSRRRWTTILATIGKLPQSMKVNIFVSAVSGLFLKLIYHRAGTVAHLQLLKLSVTHSIWHLIGQTS